MLETRLSLIAEKLEKNGNVEVKSLAKQLGVTEKTIRSDLLKMEKMGLLKKVHGGAVSTVRRAEDAYVNAARTISLSSKEKIARLAFDYFRQFGFSGKVFFIDASTTNYEFSRYLKNTESIVITNDLLVASNLSTSSVFVHVTGGRMTNNVNKYLVGIDAVEMINKHNGNYCFVGTSSIDINNGLMTMNNEDIAVKRAMIDHADTVVCLADHTKFGNSSFVKFAEVKDIDIIITDEIDENTRKRYEGLGITIISGSDDIPAGKRTESL